MKPIIPIKGSDSYSSPCRSHSSASLSFVDLSAWIVRSAIATLVLHFFEYEYHIQTYFINNSQLALSFGNKQTKVPKVALVFKCI